MHAVFCRCCEGLESDYPYRFLYLHTPSVTTTDFEGEGDRCLLSGAVSLCSPFNVALTDDDMNKVFNKVYINGLETSQSKVFRRHAALFKEVYILILPLFCPYIDH
ncbi:hypothetical protein Tco_0397418 [Tanacetum coccineum]